MISATGLVGVAAGVPYVAYRPAPDCERAPLVAVLHLMDRPRSVSAMAAALPLATVPAWRAYLGLPMLRARELSEGMQELPPLSGEDALNLMGPVVEQAAQELPGALAALSQQLPVAKAPVVLVGVSVGAAAVLLALAEGPVRVGAAVLVNAAVRAADVVAAAERTNEAPYPWTDASRRMADRLDFVRRAGDIASSLPQPGVLIVNGQEDHPAYPRSADDLYEALSSRWWSPAQVERVRIPGLGHTLAEDPGNDTAPRTRGAALVDEVVGAWLTRRLAS
jgi:pimeloyl-ACP methyl ester carboxylesterase